MKHRKDPVLQPCRRASWQETAVVLSDPEFRDEVRAGVKALRARRAKTFRGRELDRLFQTAR